MSFPFFISRKYFFSRKSKNAINIITGISIGGVLTGTMALVIVLSVFNGFEGLVIRLFNSFDPDIRISVNEGKSFDSFSIPIEKIRQVDGVEALSCILEENALVKYSDRQYIATIKGVDENFHEVSGIDTMIVAGDFNTGDTATPLAVIGNSIAYYLGVNLNDFTMPVSVFVPRRSASLNSDPAAAFNRMNLLPAGVFSIQQEFDEKYIIVPLGFVQELLESENRLSAVEMRCNPQSDPNIVAGKIQELVGSDYSVSTRYELHAYLHKIMNAEKWAVFLILSFILIIATFNVIGTQSMMIIEKKRDIALLQCMGADVSTIRGIFFRLGTMVVWTGTLGGILLGWLVCFLQQTYGFVKIGGGGAFLLSEYPIEMKIMDFLAVFAVVSLIGLVTAVIPLRQIRRQTVIREVQN
ncbi:MAG: ABC transporter permease [Bacteroidetes bacterium]|nr:ABC transporter permease [Bacteroidota bacterium]